MFEMGPIIKVIATGTPRHYHPEGEPYKQWQEQVMGKAVMVREYLDDVDYDEKDYHIVNCPENDALGFFHTRHAYQRKYMCLSQDFFTPIEANHAAKGVLSKME